MKKRVRIPERLQKQVLKEFNHRCAMCGADRPHVHHIDDNPGNNEAYNLLPLCPSCHLQDLHDPTAILDKGIIKLFRKYKNPSILSSQFSPLHKRFKFIYAINASCGYDEIYAKAKELVDFVKHLKMGEFYSERISQLLFPPATLLQKILNSPDMVVAGRGGEQDRLNYIGQLRRNTDETEILLIEILRYQDWVYENAKKRQPTTG
jgi:hypothetical protein